MHALWLMAVALPVWAQMGDTVALLPATITECRGGFGRTTVTWQSSPRRPLVVRVGAPDGPPFNDAGGSPSGSATTEDWVADGTVFYLMDGGTIAANAVARLNCQTLGPAIRDSFDQSPYFPLQVGNRWLYRYNSRAVTAEYQRWEVTGSEEIGDVTWYIVQISGPNAAATTQRYRNSDDGKVLRLTATGETVALDPEGSQPLTRVVTEVGIFTGGRFTNYSRDPFSRVSDTWVRGIGLVRSSVSLIAGSSGGFSDGLELIEAQIGGLRLPGPPASVSLGIERTRLNLTARGVNNCAVPCYFVACGLAGFTDPQGTYKPCTSVRLETRNSPAGDARVELRDASGKVVYQATVRSASENTTYLRVPLYTGASQLLAPGRYQLSAILADESRREVATSSIGVDIE